MSTKSSTPSSLTLSPASDARPGDAWTILESIDEGVYGVDLEGRATFINPAATRLLGWTSEDFVGRTTHELVHHSHADGRPYPVADCSMYKAIVEGEGLHVDNEVFWRRDGSCFPVGYTTTPLLDDGAVIGAVVTFRDISERIAAQHQLVASEKRFRTLTDNAPVGIFQTDAKGRCEFVNEAWSMMAGIDASEARGYRWAETLHPDDRERVIANWLETIKTGIGRSSEHRLRGRNGGPDIWVVRHTVALRDESGTVTGFIGTVTDITAHREARAEARTDALTGLPNRRAFLEDLERERVRALRSGRPLSLVLLDLDHFKEVNDHYGHPAGDEVLRETALRLRSVAREGDTVGRLGGEEFAWLLPETSLDAARGAADRGRRVIGATPFSGIGTRTISAGVSALVIDDATGDQLLLRADKALYRAKSAGRNAVAV